MSVFVRNDESYLVVFFEMLFYFSSTFVSMNSFKTSTNCHTFRASII